MSKIKQSFAWWSFSQEVGDIPNFFKGARQIGYQGVELLPRDLWPAAIDAGLVIASEKAESLTNGLNWSENHAEIEKDVQDKLELAVKYHIPNLIVFSGNRMGINDVDGASNTVEGLRRLAPSAEAAGVNLVLELLNSKIDHPDYQCDHTNWAVDVIMRVNSPRVKILYDIYHMQIMEGDIIRSIQQHYSLFGHVHTAGNPGRRDLDGDQELNYPGIIRSLKNAGYDGFIGQEFIPKGDALTALQMAFELCDV
jgi:hydroxypyruvate isomerase